MGRTLRTDEPYWSGDNRLLETLLSDCQQARVTLDQLANTFSRRESQLRNAIASLEEPSLRVKPGTIPFGEADSGMPSIAFFCLGKFRTEVQGTPVESRGRNKAPKILKFLVQRRGRTCPREMLLEALWPEGEPEAASNRLRVALYDVRQIFATSADIQNIITYQNGGYGLNPNIDMWVDAEEFEALWSEGLRCERDGRSSEAARSYEQAEMLYQGDYLGDDLYEEWTVLRRESLRDAYLHLLGKLAAWCMEERDYGNCISRCHKLLAEDPYREDAYRLLMRCYVAIGEKASALHWYEICVANLRKGLDIEPSAQTITLQHQMIAGEV